MTIQDYNLFAHFHTQLVTRGSDELLTTEQDRTLSYSEIDRSSARIARYLTQLGLRPGERVSVQVRKSPENLCLYLACLRGGFVFHPLNMGYKKAELEYFLSNAEPSVIVCDCENENSMGDLAQGAGVQHVMTLDRDGNGTLMSGAGNCVDEFRTVSRNADDLATLLYSSGTTGVPKGIMLTHRNLLSNTEALVQAWGFTQSDRLLHALPVFHVHGLFVATGCVLLSGASMRWLAAFDVDDVCKFLPECTVMMGVPTFYTRLLAQPAFDAVDLGNVRLFVSGSAPLREETFAEFEARCGHRILERYGMTETNMNTSNPLEGERKPGTVGPPLPGVDVRVVGDDGGALGCDETGNLQVRGPNVFVGYWRNPDKTAADFTADGFFDTGDLARIDEDGYVSIVGRTKDLVITGGLNVYPKEVELFIDDLPGIKESAVIGVPHPDFGEAVVALVVADRNISAQDIVDMCRQGLANFKAPKKVVFVDELPRNTMAKVQKNILREQYADLLV